MTNNGVCFGQYNDLVFGIMRGIKMSKLNFLNGETNHVTPNPIAVKGKVIKVYPSYFCGGV